MGVVLEIETAADPCCLSVFYVTSIAIALSISLVVVVFFEGHAAVI